MAWIQARERMPEVGATALCRLKHCISGNVQEHSLTRVDEDDCSWRTADDGSEISYSWDVVEWYEEGPAAGASAP